MTAKADRYNEGKPDLTLLDPDFLLGVAKVMGFGAEKYDRNNWKKGDAIEVPLASLLRHAMALVKGEIIDPESGLPHAHHLGCNAMFIDYYSRMEPVYKGLQQAKEGKLTKNAVNLKEEE